METIFFNNVKFNFNKIVEFKQDKRDLFECFFFKDGVLVTSQFLTLLELNKVKNVK
jgi:hypothetical protein